jgi:hypothetical protein
MNIEQFLMLLSGLAWSIVYVDSIRVGIKDKSYAMPFWALALNIAWELLHAILGFREVGASLQVIINAAWFLLDIGLLYTFFRYGRKYFPENLHKRWFYGWAILGLLSAFLVQYAFIVEFGLWMAAVYSAFLQNLLMSILFIAMLNQRKSSEGQSMLIAISKCIGTIAPTILMGYIGIKSALEPNYLVRVIGFLIAVFDLIYIWLLVRTKNSEKKANLAH